MKKLFFFGVTLLIATFAMAQAPTVSVSKAIFEYCETTEGDTILEVDPLQFPLTFCGYNFTNYGTKVDTKVNARGCDSIVSYIVRQAPGEVNGEFSVSATVRVKFAHGNLRYRASDNTWGFAIHQYDYLGNGGNNLSLSPTSSSWLDMFGYGTSGYGGHSPCNASTSYQDYPQEININNTQYDWGVRNAMYNGGNQANQWRTLTKSEWEYLLSSGRTNATQKRSLATVSGVYGLVILPDNFTWPISFSWSPTTSSYGTNVFTLAQWNAMEKNGAVFLPACGYRNGTERLDTSTGCYWSSSYTDQYNSYYVSFNTSDGLKAGNDRFVYRAISVRLVKNVQ